MPNAMFIKAKHEHVENSGYSEIPRNQEISYNTFRVLSFPVGHDAFVRVASVWVASSLIPMMMTMMFVMGVRMIIMAM